MKLTTEPQKLKMRFGLSNIAVLIEQIPIRNCAKIILALWVVRDDFYLPCYGFLWGLFSTKLYMYAFSMKKKACS